MPHSPKFEASSFLSDDKSPSLRSSLSFRRNRRIPFLLSFPLTLLLIYFLLTSWLDRSHLFLPPPPYLSHASKRALQNTIVLPKIQYNFRNGEGVDIERREKVKEAIQRTWELYSQQAWGWDEVRPVRGGGRDPRLTLSLSLSRFELIVRNGWGATIVDGLSTLLIAGLQDEVVSALNYTVKIDFTSPDGLVDPFETIIRYNSSIDVLIVDMSGDLFQRWIYLNMVSQDHHSIPEVLQQFVDKQKF
jgi:Glycosyl hydrolase family 47